MTRTRNLQPKDFSKIKFFPGTTGNPFDIVLHLGEKLEKLPPYALLLILAVLAILPNLPKSLKTGFLSPLTGVLFFFFISDWILLAALPRTRHSYGPVKPVLLLLAFLRSFFFLLPFPWNVLIELIGSLLVVIGFYIEPFHLDFHEEQFKLTKISKAGQIRILHLGDLHIERFTHREERILELVKRAAPDLILFSGDILNLSFLQDEQAQADARRFLKQLSAPLGVFAVAGSPAVDLPDLFPHLLEGTDVTWLDNRAIAINSGNLPLMVYGLSCSHNPARDELALQKMLAEEPLIGSNLNLLLHHSPDFAPNASKYGFELQLSGHTHGGQVCIPPFGALYCGSLYKKAFESGRYLVNGMNLYVTRGLGMEGAIAPRVRLFCRPEMILWTVSAYSPIDGNTEITKSKSNIF